LQKYFTQNDNICLFAFSPSTCIHIFHILQYGIETWHPVPRSWCHSQWQRFHLNYSLFVSDRSALAINVRSNCSWRSQKRNLALAIFMKIYISSFYDTWKVRCPLQNEHFYFAISLYNFVAMLLKLYRFKFNSDK